MKPIAHLNTHMLYIYASLNDRHAALWREPISDSAFSLHLWERSGVKAASVLLLTFLFSNEVS